MATNPRTEQVISLPPALAFALGVQAAPRSAVEAVIERMIEALNDIDGEADDEESGDPEQTEDEGEPDFSATILSRSRERAQASRYGAGCNISDPDYGVDDTGEDDREGV